MTTANDLMGRTALVTGASGFIGSRLCQSLRAAGAIVHGVSRSIRTGGGCERWWRSDLTELDGVRGIMNTVRPHFVFHLASEVVGNRDVAIIPSTFKGNLTSAVNLLTAATENGGSRILLIGSLEEPEPGMEWAVPSSPYAAAKYAASTYGRMFHRLYGTQVVFLRLFMVYGPAQRDLKKLVPYVTLSLLEKRAPELSSGQRRVDWIYVDDVVQALMAAAVAPHVDGKTLDVGSGELVTVREVVDELVRQINPSIEPRFGAVAERPYEQERKADVAAITAALDWRPRVALKEGLANTVQWYRSQTTGTATTQAGN